MTNTLDATFPTFQFDCGRTSPSRARVSPKGGQGFGQKKPLRMGPLFEFVGETSSRRLVVHVVQFVNETSQTSHDLRSASRISFDDPADGV